MFSIIAKKPDANNLLEYVSIAGFSLQSSPLVIRADTVLCADNCS